MNRKLIRGTANFFGCIGLGVAIVGLILNNSAIAFTSTVEVLACLTIRNFCGEKKPKGDD